mgnify:CR=1 FL=1
MCIRDSNYTTPHDKINGVVIANERGAWATTWKVHRFTRKRSGIGPGDGDVERMRAISAVDPSDFSVITTAPLAFCRVTDRANANGTADDAAAASAAASSCDRTSSLILLALCLLGVVLAVPRPLRDACIMLPARPQRLGLRLRPRPSSSCG